MFASRRLPAAARKHQSLISISNSNRPDLSHHPALFFKTLDVHPARYGSACQVDLMQDVPGFRRCVQPGLSIRIVVERPFVNKAFCQTVLCQQVILSNGPLSTRLFVNKAFCQQGFLSNGPLSTSPFVKRSFVNKYFRQTVLCQTVLLSKCHLSIGPFVKRSFVNKYFCQTVLCQQGFFVNQSPPHLSGLWLEIIDKHCKQMKILERFEWNSLEPMKLIENLLRDWSIPWKHLESSR